MYRRARLMSNSPCSVMHRRASFEKVSRRECMGDSSCFDRVSAWLAKNSLAESWCGEGL